ncbi:low affinity immunoglobulin epsilon Fc receptor-like [Glandiceps talaboti]
MVVFEGSCKVQFDECDCRIYHVYCQQDDDDRQYCPRGHQFCNSNYDGLAVLDHPVKSQAVHEYITRHGWHLKSNGCIRQYGFWINLVDTRVEGHFVWGPATQGDRNGLCSNDFSNWAPGEPNNNPKKDDRGQDCVQLWYRGKKNGRWDDEYINYRPKGAVCETRVPHCDYEAYGLDHNDYDNCLNSEA